MTSTVADVSAAEFDQIAAGLRWSAKNLAAARALLVDQQPVKDVAESHDMSQQQARVLTARFLSRVRAHRATKVSPDEYLAQLATLDLFIPALMKLRRNGLTDDQLVDYLKQNDLTATAEQVAELLNGRPPTKQRVKRE